jgi:Hom_end-associated Hint/Type III restriction enzyme, res subunit
MRSSTKKAPAAAAPKAPVETPYTITEEYKQRVREQSYIGRKGYTIPKSVLDPRDLEILYKDLYMIPAKGGGGAVFGSVDDDAFPVYRENSKKLYLPRYYGMERYGSVPVREMGTPVAIKESCTFDKPLRDYQEEIIASYMKTIDHESSDPQGGIIQIYCGGGKCVGKDTKILMYDGTTKVVQKIKVGEKLMGDDSTPRTVLSIARGRETMYRIRDPRHNSEFIVNKSHILSVKAIHHETRECRVMDMTVGEYLKRCYMGVNVDNTWTYYGYRVPIDFDADVVRASDRHITGVSNYELTDDQAYQNGFWASNFDQICYRDRCSPRRTRLQILAGLIDSNGKLSKRGNYYIYDKSREFLEGDVMFLLRSLGYDPVLSSSTGDDMWQLKFYGYNGRNEDEIPVREEENQWKPNKKRKLVPDIYHMLYVMDIQPLPEDDYYGFEIDGNRRFVLGDFTVTHNTVMSIKILSLLRVKTLIIVHKEFLLNQWVERIKEFLPTASIGRIQGPIWDVAGKDIVIGMLQTLYDREFEQGENAFDEFGLTIVDEVHRIGSCQFSKALLRIQTPYTLGVTATLERKDGLTKLIHMFMGPLVYSKIGGSTVDSDCVIVRGMTFVSNDPTFNDVVTDFRGQTLYSTMITKLCNHGPRTRFVLDVLAGLVEETPEAQILILAHNRSLLTDLYEAIEAKEFATCGYYVGGMKQRDLDKSTEKQILLATYAMAAEGFDHKNLSILVMITPKTDIVQSVGRIFRANHDRKIIVDIIDQHDIFQNQWRKRRAYYRKSGYHIHTLDSIQYKNGEEWKNETTPNRGGRKPAHMMQQQPHPHFDKDISERKCLIDLEL